MVALEAGDPARLGPFTLVDRLGEGGQGVVFLGHGPQGEQVAVKLLHTRLTADPEARERFLREVALAQRVAPFCTAPVLHADLAGNQPYIVSEFVPGPSLRQLVDREGPRRGAALERLAISTATALAAIHRAGITHRDFKPANVLMGPEGPVVIDFGVARAVDSPQATATGASIGTPAYLAPEVLSGGTAGAPADMFAWGVTMVFAATGRPAFGADSIPSVITRILRDEPDLGDLAAPLRDIVAACLSKDPAPRPSAQDVVARLTGQAHLTPPSPPLPPAQAAAPPGHVTVPAAARRPRRTVLTWTAAGIGVPALVAAAFLVPSWVSVRAAGSETAATEAPGQAASAPAEPPIPPPSGLATPSGHRTGSPSPGSATRRPGSRPDARPGATARPAASPAHGRRARPSPTATGPAAEPTEAPPTAKASPAPTKATATPKPSPTAKATPTKTAAPKPNPYTAKGVCGTGFAVVDSHSYGGQATTYLLYNASTGRNCVITLSRYTMPAKIRMSVVLKVKGGASAADAGAYTVYAGPLRLPAKGRCVIWGGGYGGASWSSAWSHCG